MEEKAQSGAVFRLLIDSIIGIAILMIVLGAMANFYDMRLKTSAEEFKSLVKNAVDSPNGAVVESGALVFNEGGGFSQATLSSTTGIDASCFTFQSELSRVDVGGGIYLKFSGNVETKVYARCIPEENSRACEAGEEGCCNIKCFISLGKRFTQD